MINDRLLRMRDFAQQRQYNQYRTHEQLNITHTYRRLKANFAQRSALLLEFMCKAEDPIVFPEERISFIRTRARLPFYYSHKDLKRELKWKKGIVYEPFHNITPDYGILLKDGLSIHRERAVELQATLKDKNEKKYIASVIQSIDVVLHLAHRYEIAARVAGNEEVAQLFARVPAHPAESFQEALQSLRFISSIFNMADNYQFGFGRMDQYLLPYYEHDLEAGKITKEEAYELVAEFFIGLNKDTDLYFGVQQGDNGQSVMLGGCKPESGTSAVNALTYLILEVSRDLKLIDPKINLRIDSNTPDDLLELGCELTRCGLGFPQYSNDEVVIPALVKKGYSIEDARNYTVAACWEFIIPGKGIEIVNQGAVSLPAAVDVAFERAMKSFGGFNMDKCRRYISKNIEEQIKNILTKRNIRILPSPFASLFFHSEGKYSRDAALGVPYQNIGIHGAGSANAADALAAIRITWETEGLSGLRKLLEAKQKNFEGFSELREKLLHEMPKVGNADERVDNELKFLFDTFADVADALSSDNRKIRPGSGSAMYYIWLTQKYDWVIEPVVDATADGKLKGEALSTSLAPSHGIKVDGVLSVLKSYSVIDYSRIVNGGPITIELSPSVFCSEDGIKKLSQLIKYFVKLGNQQLQLNVLDAAVLEDAMAHPERHRNLIVRVWGWSGYFTELAPEYQHHVLNRHKYSL
ncbi:MAG: hypothetical protein IJN29_11235 [Akkermansia sp.]|nr:hypothetical protein [Akkermansia sp.]